MNLRDTISQGGLLCLGGYVRSADEEVNANWAVVDLDAVQGCGSLRSLVGAVEDNSRASEALAVRSVLHEDLLGPANANCGSKVILKGVLVVVVG